MARRGRRREAPRPRRGSPPGPRGGHAQHDLEGEQRQEGLLGRPDPARLGRSRGHEPLDALRPPPALGALREAGDRGEKSREGRREGTRAAPGGEEALSFEDEEPLVKAKDACGIFGIAGDPEAVAKTFYGLFALQHRGQESAGIASTSGNGKLELFRGMGHVGQVFDERALTQLKNPIAIGHVRYSTMGSSTIANAQPLVANTHAGAFAVAHNGNLTNGPALRKDLEERGSIFQATADSEVILHLLARTAGASDSLDRVSEMAKELRGAFSLLMLTPGGIAAVRDAHGFRPLWLGRTREGAWAFSSETPAFDLTGVEPVREISPGTVVMAGKDGLRELRFAKATPRHCVFEHVYFSRPDGVLFGDAVQSVRKKLGRALAREHPIAADIVVPVPDSGNEAALGYSLESGIPYEHGFIRNHYVGRTFIQPTAAARATSADLKLNVVKTAVKGRRVIVVDDSVVRGTTARRRVRYLRDAGAEQVHLRVSCPPLRNPCFYGIDFQSKGELVAAEKTIDELAKLLEVDSLGYLSVEGMLACLSSPPGNYCTACWTGDYPVPIPPGLSKGSLEC
ncbi:amidophosphoribosyltransferase [bacterium]|nr:amidophosphoribosyltransferase [bacterium]